MIRLELQDRLQRRIGCNANALESQFGQHGMARASVEGILRSP
jgi:hypothetical protein